MFINVAKGEIGIFINCECIVLNNSTTTKKEVKTMDVKTGITKQQIRLPSLHKAYLQYYSEKLHCSEHKLILQAIVYWANNKIPKDELECINRDVLSAESSGVI
jgi:predicted metal-dependent hydrolase